MLDEILCSTKVSGLENYLLALSHHFRLILKGDLIVEPF